MAVGIAVTLQSSCSCLVTFYHMIMPFPPGTDLREGGGEGGGGGGVSRVATPIVAML